MSDVDKEEKEIEEEQEEQEQKKMLSTVTKPLARLLEPLRIATILNIYLSNGM